MNEMKIAIPDQLIEDTIRAELVRNITDEKRDVLLNSVVSSALTKKRDNYGETTVFQDAVTKMIEKEVKSIFQEWINENRENISKALKSYLMANKQKVLTDFCEKLSKNIMSYGVSVDLNLSRED